MCGIFSLLLGIHLGEMAVDGIGKGAHIEQSINTGLEAEDKSGKQNKRKMGYPVQDPVSLKRGPVSLAMIEFSKWCAAQG